MHLEEEIQNIARY